MLQLIKFVIGGILLLLFASSCNPAKRASTANIKSKSANFILKKMDRQAFNPEWLSGRAKVNINYEGQRFSATLNLKMRKDSIIWVNLKKLGLEIGRLKITPDSIHLLDRFNKNYLARGIDELTSTYGLPADFGTLQDVLLGNAYFWNKEELESSVKNNHYELNGIDGRKNFSYAIDPISFYLLEQILQDQERDWTLEANYEGYGATLHPNFSYIRNIKVIEPQSVELTLSFTKVDVDLPQQISFNIPSHYTPMQLE